MIWRSRTNLTFWTLIIYQTRYANNKEKRILKIHAYCIVLQNFIKRLFAKSSHITTRLEMRKSNANTPLRIRTRLENSIQGMLIANILREYVLFTISQRRSTHDHHVSQPCFRIAIYVIQGLRTPNDCKHTDLIVDENVVFNDRLGCTLNLNF